MSAYLVIDSEVFDPGIFAQYAAAVKPVIERHAGEYVVASERITPLAGDWAPRRIVIIRFPDVAALRACFGSAEYQAIAHLRQNSTRGRSIIVEG